MPKDIVPSGTIQGVKAVVKAVQVLSWLSAYRLAETARGRGEAGDDYTQPSPGR